MKYAPFLLQAFAARVLANQQDVTVSHEELRAQGYDVETLIEMVGAYTELREEERGFHVVAGPTTISLRRKVNAPAVPPVNTPPAASAPKPAAAKPTQVSTRAIAGIR